MKILYWKLFNVIYVIIISNKGWIAILSSRKGSFIGCLSL